MCQSLKQLFTRILPCFTLFYFTKSPAHTAQVQIMYLNDLKRGAAYCCGYTHQHMNYSIEEGLDFSIKDIFQ